MKALDSLSRLFRLMPEATLGNRYRLDRCLGEGTYGFVWKAERLTDHYIVALKVPKAQGDRNSELEEGRILIGRPPHRNVISVHWMGRVPPEREVFVIEMEFFNSHTLAFLLDSRDERLVSTYRHVLALYEQVLDGVCHLHSLGLVHGDIKPQNILVQGDIAKLTDFGSSLITQDLYVRSRENGGTILYSPPEFAGISTRRRKGSAQLAIAHDVYSLGVLLYQLVTGQLPHDTLAQVVRHTPFPRPRELSTSIAPELEAVILRALEREPEHRWRSVVEMRDAFLAARVGQLAHRTDREPPIGTAPVTDWSTKVLDLMKKEAWGPAEAAARAELERSRDPEAFLLMVRSIVRDGRYFEALKAFESYPGFLAEESRVVGDLEELALETYIGTERIRDAERMVERCLVRQGERPGLLLRQASLLGLKADYRPAADLLLRLNRELPRRRTILRRLVIVHEQMRDWSRADAFRRVIEKVEAEEA